MDCMAVGGTRAAGFSSRSGSEFSLKISIHDLQQSEKLADKGGEVLVVLIAEVSVDCGVFCAVEDEAAIVLRLKQAAKPPGDFYSNLAELNHPLLIFICTANSQSPCWYLYERFEHCTSIAKLHHNCP